MVTVVVSHLVDRLRSTPTRSEAPTAPDGDYNEDINANNDYNFMVITMKISTLTKMMTTNDSTPKNLLLVSASLKVLR